MKNILFVLYTLSLVSFFTGAASAQEISKKIKTEEFTVDGVCVMCKKRIEKAALIPGVLSSTWDQDLQMLKVIYKPVKVTLQEIKNAVSNSGHDTDETKASDEVYSSLPNCCAYRDGVKAH